MHTLTITSLPESVLAPIASLRDSLQKAHSELFGGGNERLFRRIYKEAEQLSEGLLSPHQIDALRALPFGEHLTISASLACHAVPWELLLVDGDFLGERFSVGRHVTNSGHAHANRTPLPNQPVEPVRSYVIVANSPELVAASPELTGVLRRLRYLHHDHADLVAMPATPLACPPLSDFVALLSKSDWLHFAGHADTVAERRCLALAPLERIRASVDPMADGLIVGPGQLSHVTATPQTVFLNACGALEVPDIETDDASSLVHAFLGQGTEWMIGPVAPVLDQQTTPFTDEFYARIVNGCTMGQAMRLARLESTRRLGRHNVVGFSYVLYGDPSGSPWAHLSLADASCHDKALHAPPEPAMNTTAAWTISFPLTCQRCEKTIETEDGIGRRETGDSAGVVCWTCHRQEQKDRPRYFQPVPRHSMTTPSQDGRDSRLDQDVLPPDVAAFAGYVDECLSRPLSVPDMDGTGTTVVTFTPTNERQSPAARSAAALRRAKQVRWAGTWNVDQTPADTPTCIQTILLDSTGVDSGDFDALGISADQLEQLLQQFRDAGAHVHLFVASTTGFSDDGQQLIRQPPRAGRIPKWLTVYLYDVAREETVHCPADSRAWQFVHLFGRATTSQQFLQAVNWLQKQLPLVVSLGSIAVAAELQLERDAVQAAMRLVAFQNRLCVEDTEEFGLVLSERSLANESALQQGRHSLGWTRIFRALTWVFQPIMSLLKKC